MHSQPKMTLDSKTHPPLLNIQILKEKIMQNDLQGVEALLINQDLSTYRDLIPLAMDNKNPVMACLLAAKGAPYSAQDIINMFYDEFNQDIRWLDVLLTKPSAKNNFLLQEKKFGDTPLILAIYLGDKSRLFKLLDAGAGVSIRMTNYHSYHALDYIFYLYNEYNLNFKSDPGIISSLLSYEPKLTQRNIKDILQYQKQWFDSKKYTVIFDTLMVLNTLYLNGAKTFDHSKILTDNHFIKYTLHVAFKIFADYTLTFCPNELFDQSEPSDEEILLTTSKETLFYKTKQTKNTTKSESINFNSFKTSLRHDLVYEDFKQNFTENETLYKECILDKIHQQNHCHAKSLLPPPLINLVQGYLFFQGVNEKKDETNNNFTPKKLNK